MASIVHYEFRGGYGFDRKISYRTISYRTISYYTLTLTLILTLTLTLTLTLPLAVALTLIKPLRGPMKPSVVLVHAVLRHIGVLAE